MSQSPIRPRRAALDLVLDGLPAPAVRTPGGAFLRLVDPPADVAATGPAPATVDYLNRLAVEVDARDEATRSTRWSQHCAPVHVSGDSAIARDLIAILADAGVPLTAHDYALDVRVLDGPGPDAVRPPDAARAPGTARLLAYREGAMHFVDPLQAEDTDPTPSQVRRRRYAATPAAAELAAWHRTNAVTGGEPGTRSPYADHAVLDRLLHVIRAWALDGPELRRLRRTLWRFDGLALTASEHTVLAFDEPAPGRR